MIRGMETQLAEWEAHMDAQVASTPCIRIGVLFARVFLSGAPLLKLPSLKTPVPDAAATLRADPQRLMSVIPALHEMYEYFLALQPAQVNSFMGIEWGALILGIILGFRMSFPLAQCPGWDDRAGREAVRFGEYIDRFCKMGGDGAEDAADIRARLAVPGGGSGGSGGNQGPTAPGGGVGGQRKSMDVLTASKIVLEMVRRKYVKRVAKLEGPAAVVEGQQQQHQAYQEPGSTTFAPPPHPIHVSQPNGGSARSAYESNTSGCPMMDGSLEPFYPYWDETFNSNVVAGSFTTAPGAAHQGGGLPPGETEPNPTGLEAGMPNDLWMAMTMNWAQGDVGFDVLPT